DPDVAHDPVHPTVEPRTFLPPGPVGERAFERHLAEIVAVRRIARQPGGETAQPGQQVQQVLFELRAQCLCLPRIKRTTRCVSSMLNRFRETRDSRCAEFSSFPPPAP